MSRTKVNTSNYSVEHYNAGFDALPHDRIPKFKCDSTNECNIRERAYMSK